MRHLRLAERDTPRVRAYRLDDQDLPAASVRITCLPSPAECLQPGSSVCGHPYDPLTPRALGRQLGGIALDSTHTEPYGTFRSER